MSGIVVNLSPRPFSFYYHPEPGLPPEATIKIISINGTTIVITTKTAVAVNSIGIKARSKNNRNP
jgi:hypothetical protein